MIHTPLPDPEDNPRSVKRWRRWLIWGSVGLGLTSVTIAGGVSWFIHYRLASTIATALEGTLDRPVEVGPVERFGIISVRFGRSVIPPTDTDPNTASLEAIEASISIISLLTPTVGLNLRVINPQVYLEQDELGNWIRTEIAPGDESPVDVEIGSITIENANVKLMPQTLLTAEVREDPIALNVDRLILDISDQNDRIRTHLTGEFHRGGNIQVRADGILSAGDFDTTITANSLNLPQLGLLVNTPGIILGEGEADAQLRVKLANFQPTGIWGNLQLREVQAILATLSEPVTITNANLGFEETEATVETLEIAWGDLGVTSGGTIRTNAEFDLLQTEFDLQANLLPVTLATLLETADRELGETLVLPVQVAGEVTADINLTGNLQQPQLEIAIATTEATQIDRVIFSEISTEIAITPELDQQFNLVADPSISINNLRIKPISGGEISGAGSMQLTGLTELLRAATLTTESPEEFVLQPTVEFTLDIDSLYLDAIASLYELPNNTRLGDMFATAKVSGSLDNLQGDINFNLPNGTLPILGSSQITKNQLTANIAIAEGIVNANVQLADNNNWIATLNANELGLDPLVKLGLPLANLPPEVQLIIGQIDLRQDKLNLDTTITGQLDKLNLNDIIANGNFNLTIANGEINSDFKLIGGKLGADFLANRLNLQQIIGIGLPLINLPPETLIQLQTLDFSNGTVQSRGVVSADLNNFDPNNITANAIGDINLGNMGGVISFRETRLANGVFNLELEANSIHVNPWLNVASNLGNLPPETREKLRRSPELRNSRLNGVMIAGGNLNNLNQIKGSVNGLVNLPQLGGEITARGEIEAGDFEGTIISNNLPLNPLINLGLPLANLPANVVAEIRNLDLDNPQLQGETRFSGNLASMTPEALTISLDGQLNLGRDGIIKATGRTQAGDWNANIIGDRIALNRFSPLVENLTGIETALRPTGLLNQAQNMPLLRGLLDTELNARGSVTEFNPATLEATSQLRLTELPIIRQPLEAIARLKNGQVNIDQAETPQFGANGLLALEFSGSGVPSLANVDLNLRVSNFDLNSPLVEPLLANLPSEILRGEVPPLAGNVSFAGQLKGAISALNLQGDVRLENFALRSLIFDPVMTGTLTAGLGGGGVTLALSGQQDKIELVLDDRFLPTAFLVQRGNAIAKGTTPSLNQLQITLEYFPIDQLGIYPIVAEGYGNLGGDLAVILNITNLASLDINQIGATGEISVQKPSLGHIEADSFTITQLNLSRGQFSFNDGELRLGETQVFIAGQANLGAIIAQVPDSPEEPQFQADIRVPQGRLQDIFTALEWFQLSDIANGLQQPQRGTAADLETVAVGLSETATLHQQLQRWAEINALLEQWEIKQKENASPFPPLEQVNAKFDAEIKISGSPANLTATADINGADWTWGEYRIDELGLEASFEDNIVRVLPLRVRYGETLVGFQGQLDLDEQIPSGQLRVKNFRLETIEEFYDIPNIALSGQLNLRALLAGSLDNPQASGEFTVLEGLFNDEPLKEARGSFNYNNARFNLGGTVLVTEQDPIEYRASVPFRLPFAKVRPESNLVSAEVQMLNEGFKIINLLNPEVSWVEGQGLVQMRARGVLEQADDGSIKNILIEPDGVLKLEDVVLRLASNNSSITGLSGTATFLRNRLRVKGMEGELLGDAGTGKVVIDGVLPIFEPMRPEDPDIDSPLKMVLENLKLNLALLYQGKAAGEIVIGGTALQPGIGGQVVLFDGAVTLPEADQPPATDNGDSPELLNTGPVEVSLNNFMLTLGEHIQVRSASITPIFDAPVLNFNANGTIIVNGDLDSLESLRPQGTIELTGGAVNLYTSRFQLDRGYPQRATFVPEHGLNPILDVRLVTRVSETTPAVASTSAFETELMEVPRAAQFGTVRTIRVTALAQGLASEINDILELRSSPPRSEIQLLALLGGSAIEGVTGDTTLVLANIASAGLFNEIQQSVLAATGLTEFRIYPARVSQSQERSGSTALGLGLEVGLDVTNDVSVSVSRVLAANQPTQFNLNYRVNDRLLLRGATNFGNESEVRFEYETRF
ncbi:translocation/assembly module TamB domain-containing protein [Limnospira fusiformis PMC 851.14]|uniref:Translocation/assembly module TamB domain-containing protein n=1 Tax=Limnospira fusiformis PMC 851.14 TaxID=2219512 RepID=A0ABU9EJ05_LIMFS